MTTRTKPNAPSRILSEWLLMHPEHRALRYPKILALATADGLKPFSNYVLWAARQLLPVELRPMKGYQRTRVVIDMKKRTVSFEQDGIVRMWEMDKLKRLNTLDAVRQTYWAMGYVPTTITHDKRGNVLKVVLTKRARPNKTSKKPVSSAKHNGIWTANPGLK